MANTRNVVLAALAALAGAATLSQTALAEDGSKEKCYGISLAEKNAWKYVPMGTCLTTTATLQAARRIASLEPSKS